MVGSISSNFNMARRVYGIGVDVALVSRFECSFARFGERLLLRVLHPMEIVEFHARPSAHRAMFLASRWAVKEATFKAFQRYRVQFPEIYAVQRGLEDAAVSTALPVTSGSKALRLQFSGETKTLAKQLRLVVRHRTDERLLLDQQLVVTSAACCCDRSRMCQFHTMETTRWRMWCYKRRSMGQACRSKRRASCLRTSPPFRTPEPTPFARVLRVTTMICSHVLGFSLVDPFRLFIGLLPSPDSKTTTSLYRLLPIVAAVVTIDLVNEANDAFHCWQRKRSCCA